MPKVAPTRGNVGRALRRRTFAPGSLVVSLAISLAGCGNSSGDGGGVGAAGAAGTAAGAGQGGDGAAAGAAGSSGGAAAGSSGAAGNAAGTAGAAGSVGSAGRGGAAGTAGASGSAGSAGRGGTTGAAGVSGAAGTVADAGRGGTTGAAGAAGRGGTTGTAGRGGTTGTAGLGGTTGTAGTTGSAGRAACGAPACFSTFQAASVAIGQPNLTSPTATDPGPVPPTTEPAAASTVYSPMGDPFFDGTTLYLSDTYNNRVLGFAGIPSASPGTATLAIGQTSVTSGTAAGSGAQQLNHPSTVLLAGGKAFVADTGNNRVVIYNLPLANNASATVAVGQTSLTSNATGCTASGLNAPQSFYVTGTKLIVADTKNNRVMIWNSIPTATPTPAADLILGQPSATSCTALAPAANTLSGPSDVWSDGTRLAVADQLNNRVLFWKTFPTSNAGADFVLGQPSFTSSKGDMTRALMGGPSALDSDGTALYIAESNNHRIMVWQQFPTSGASLPDLVLAQADFTVCNPNAGLETNYSFPTPAGWYNPNENPVKPTALFLHQRSGDQLGGGLEDRRKDPDRERQLQ